MMADATAAEIAKEEAVRRAHEQGQMAEHEKVEMEKVGDELVRVVSWHRRAYAGAGPRPLAVRCRAGEEELLPDPGPGRRAAR